MKRERRPGEEAEITPAPTSGPSSNPSGNGNDNIDPDRLIIQERKEEKRKALKEKHEEKLKTIRDRRVSGVNDEPFLEGAFQRLASNNIWEDVLGYLTDPADITSAYHTCTKFAETLEERRTLMLLPKMLETVKAFAPPELSKPILLGTRFVCKAWKDVANFCLFDLDFAKDDWFQTPEMPSPNDSKWRMSACVFEDEGSVDRATSVFSSQNQPPSFSIRTVMVVLNDKGTTGGFYRKVIEFLQKHGKSVWYFYFQWSWCYSRRFGATYEPLHEMLQCLPNLKGLSLIDLMSEVRAAREVQNFRRRLNEHPLPPLDSLVHFGCHWSDDSLLSQVSEKCVNLRSVMFRVRMVSCVSVKAAQALRRLSLERYDGSSIIIPPMATQLRSSWPLRNLTIDMRHSGIPAKVEASVLLPFLNRFAETLKVLKIIGVKILMDFDAHNQRRITPLNLPILTSLCLQTIGRGCGSLGFDDLLLLKSLEELRVITDILQEDFVKYLGEDANSKVKVTEFLENGKMSKSNVWAWFPNLMRIELSYNTIFCRPDEDQQ